MEEWKVIRLFKNYYADPDPSRNAELEQAAIEDRSNPLIENIVAIPDRPTFAEIFSRVNEIAGPRDVNVVANADCSLVDGMENLEAMDCGEAFALTRWDGDRLFSDESGKGRCDSQDAWIFRGPIRRRLLETCRFPMGKRGCDNRLLAEMADAGYRVSNPAKSIRLQHFHDSDIRHYGMARRDVVSRPYLLIAPHELGTVPELRWVR